MNSETIVQTYCNDNGVSVEFDNFGNINRYGSFIRADSIVGYGGGISSITFVVPFDCRVINFKYGANGQTGSNYANKTLVQRVSSSNVVTDLHAITSHAGTSGAEYISGNTPTKEMSVSNWFKDEKIRFEERDTGVVYIYYVEFVP